MIEAKDLMIGNWVQCYGMTFQVTEINATHVKGLPNEGQFSCDDLEPIPVDLDALLKSNLVQNDILFCAPKQIEDKSAKDRGIKYCSFFFNTRLNKWMDCQTRVTVDYVHQLQRLYLSLTKEDLILNLWQPSNVHS